MKKNWLKIILDLIMIIVIATLCNKQVISLAYHEIAGLVLGGVFLIHLILNSKWIASVSKRLFSKEISAKTKVGYIVDFSLLIAFILIIVSGILISKVVFSFVVQGPWRTIHYTASAIALILLGVHVGLHKDFIVSMIQRVIKINKTCANIVGIIITVGFFAFGCYSIVTTNFTRWLTMPFGNSNFEMVRGQFNESQGMGREKLSRPDDAKVEQNDQTSEEKLGDIQGDFKQNGENVLENELGNPSDGQLSGRPGRGNRNNPQNGMENLERENGINKMHGNLNVFIVILNYFSIMYVFATITVVLEKIIKKG